MIKDLKPLTMAEVAELVDKTEKAEKAKVFIKKFAKLNLEESKKMKKDLQELGTKLNEEGMVKIVDFMPEDAEGIIKITPDTSLDQDEINKILEVIKKY